jgi:hypothetical protein
MPTADIRLLRVRGKRPRDRRVTGSTGPAKIDVSSSAGESAMKIDGGPPWWDIAFEAEADPANRLAAFAQELQQLGWTIGSSLQID